MASSSSASVRIGGPVSSAPEETNLRSLLVEASSTPEAIISTCQAVEAFLRTRQFPSQLRAFYTTCFPTLLQKVFGFKHSDSVKSLPSSADGWLSSASGSTASKALIALLSPSGPLFRSLLNLDAQGSPLIFLFPTERLPARVQVFLSKGMPYASGIPKLFSDRFKVDNSSGFVALQLDVFEYFFFWFAYYATCKADMSHGQGNVDQSFKENSVLKSVQERSFPSWISGLRQSTETGTSIGSELSPYAQLLQVYLAYFVSSVPPLPENQPETAEYSILRRGEFIIQTFVEFWLNDGDTSYSPDNVSPNFLQALNIFVNHLNRLCFVSINSSATFAYPQKLQRALYLFLRQTLSLSTRMHHSRKVLDFVDVWLNYLQPWNAGDTKSGKEKGNCRYSEKWQSVVAANYPFYTSLIFHFLEFAQKNINVDLQGTLQMTSKILNVLAGSAELLSYLREVNTILERSVYSVSDTLPSEIRDWVQDGAIQNGIMPTTTLLQVLWKSNDNGVRHLIQLLIMKAENEIRKVPSTTQSTCSNLLDSVRKAREIIFDYAGLDAEPELILPAAVTRSNSHSFAASRAWLDVKYRGDWMRRPIETTEVAWLVRLLVRISDSINSKLKLSPSCGCQGSQATEANNIVDNSQVEKEPSETTHDLSSINMKNVVNLILRYTGIALSILHYHVRSRGWRVNLRYLAKKPIALGSLLFVVYIFWRFMVQAYSFL